MMGNPMKNIKTWKYINLHEKIQDFVKKRSFHLIILTSPRVRSMPVAEKGQRGHGYGL